MEREATIRRPKRVVTPRIVVPKKRPRRFTGTAFRRELQKLAGKLIVVEGADGSGRSTQIAKLVDWLEARPRHGAGGAEALDARQRGTGKAQQETFSAT